jgi:hypothetical protein
VPARGFRDHDYDSGYANGGRGVDWDKHREEARVIHERLRVGEVDDNAPDVEPPEPSIMWDLRRRSLELAMSRAPRTTRVTAPAV